MEQIAINYTAEPERHYYSVSELATAIRGVLSEYFTDIWVAGAHTHNPLPSHTKAFRRVFVLLLNENRCPLSGSCPKLSRTSPCEPSNPLRIPMVSTAMQNHERCRFAVGWVKDNECGLNLPIKVHDIDGCCQSFR